MTERQILGLLAVMTLLVYYPVVSYGYVYDDAIWATPYPAWLLHSGILLLHLVNGLLFYTLAKKVISLSAASIALALFWLHPIQVESVAYVSGGQDTAVVTLTLAALMAMTWTDWRGLAVLTLALLGLAQMKWSALPLLVILPLLAVRGRAWWASATVGLLGFVLVVAYGIHPLIWALSGGLQVRVEQVGVLLVSLGTLLLKVIAPINFSIEHDWSWITPLTGSLAIWVVVFAGLWLWAFRRSQPLLVGSVAWLLACLLPRAVAFPMPPLREHHLTVPLLGMWLVIGSLVAPRLVSRPIQECV